MSSLATPQQQPPAEEANQGNFSWTGSALAPDSVPGPQPQPQLIVAQQQPNVGQSPSEILQQEYDDMENAPSDGIVLPSSYNDDDDDDGNGVGLNNPTPAVVTAASTTTAASSTAAAASAASSTAAASSTSSSTKVTLVVTEGDNENKYEVDKDSLEICDLIYHEIESEDTFYIKSEDIGGGIDTLQHVINFCLSFKGSSFDIDIDMDQKLPPWVDDFIKRVAVNAETYYNLLDVAALLGIKPMLELLCKYVAAQIYNSHPSNIINEITDHTEIVKLISHEVGDISTQPSPSKNMKQCKPTILETDYNGVKVIENVNLRGEMRTLVICTQSRSFNNERLTLLGYEHLNWSAHFVPVEYICDRNSKNMTFAKMKSDKIIFQLVRTHVRCQSSSSIFVLILKLCYPVLGPN